MAREFGYREHLRDLAHTDVSETMRKDTEYNGSWQQRGGQGAFFILARKWDRIEPQAKRFGYDVFQACLEDPRPEGILDDIRDLRRYLLLVESWIVEARQEPASL